MLSETVARRLCLLRAPSSGLRAVGRPALPRITRSTVCCFPHRSGCTNMSSTGGGPAAAAHPAVPEASSGVGGGGKGEDVREQKKALRKRIKSELKQMSDEAVGVASAAVAERLLSFPQLQQQECGDAGGAVSVYLSMPKELGTSAIVSGLFKRGKKVYIPKVLGAASADMRMFPVRSEDEVASFPLTKWKIPEPSEELVFSREDGVTEGDIGVIIVPAVALDPTCNRLGHGRGHYDCFFERVNKASMDKGRPPPVTIGVCFDEQVVDFIPTESTDVRLDFVLTPTQTFRRDAGGVDVVSGAPS
ncbi:unnamed protein product [Ectocarpus sp. 8 AP-2014]